jgi:hypothetical protein
MKTPLPFCSLWILCWLLAAGGADAAIGFRQLTSVHPVAVQRGTKATVNVRSNFTLDGAYQVFFDQPGIRMKYAETKPIDAPLKGRGSAGTPFRFDVDVPADQEPRVYEFRVATRQAVSSVSHLRVTDFPVVLEDKQDNGKPDKAQKLKLPVALCGVCAPAEDVDCYRFSGKAGQELTLEVFGQRVTKAIHDMVSRGGYLLDPILTLRNSHDQVIAMADSTFGGDPVLHVKLPTDGEYTVEIRDTRYAGDPRYSYCLEISDQPWAQAVFPPVIERGTSAEVQPLGFALGATRHVRLESTAQDQPGWKTTRLKTARGLSNPVEVLISDRPEVVVTPGHHAPSEALPITLPVGLSGRFVRPNTADCFSFTAVKGQYYLFEVEANSRSLPLDALLEIFDTKAKKLLEFDDTVATQDPRIFFQAPADGPYVLSIRDLHGRAGEEFIYHLRAEPSGPDFELQGEYYYAMLAPGTRAVWFAKINRLNGFTGPVELEVTGLPPGVTYTPVTVPAKMDWCAVILSAAKDAKVGASLAHISGKAQIPGPDGKPRTIVHQGAVTCELQSQGGGQGRWPISTQLVGVVEKLDLLKVEAKPEQVMLKPGTKAEIQVKIERQEGFADPVQLDMTFVYFTIKWGEQLPPGVTVSGASKTRLTGKTLEGKIVLEASPTALPVERLPITAIAGVSISFSINTLYASNPIYLTIPEAQKPGSK